MARIITLTMNPTIDESTSAARVIPEEKIRCTDPRYEPGGGGINVARAVQHLGGAATAVWTSGGANGRFLGELLDAEGVDHVPIPIEQMTRTNLIVYEESSTQQYRFGMPGPELTSEESERCLQFMEKLDPAPDYLVLSGSLPPGVDDEFYARLVERFSSKSRIIIDTSGQALQATLEVGVFLVKPNLRELGQLFGQEIEGDAEIEAAARQLVDQQKAEVVVTSLGSGGASVLTADVHKHFRSPTVPIRSKVGAGDSMVGGIVTGLAAGWSIDEAVRYGVAAGAAAVMTPGTELCRKDDTDRLYPRVGVMEWTA